MTPNASAAVVDRVVERRRAVALARHYREFDGLAVRQIADRLGRSPATVKAYFYEPTGEKARTVQARCVGVSRACGAYTQPRSRKRRRRRCEQATQAPAIGSRREVGVWAQSAFLCRIAGNPQRNPGV
jgi:AraC-like DNA-binding protein